VYNNFEWPVPPLYELPAGEQFAGHEAAVLTLLRGQKIQGTLSRFLPGHGVVEFLPARGRVNLDVPLQDIAHLRLTRPLVLKPRETEIERRAGEPLRPPERQSFRVELANGEVLEGETIGVEMQTAGLFLYVVNYGDTVLRSFVPAAAVKSQQIGRPLGEILVAEKLVENRQVEWALMRQRELREQKLGELLAEERVISPQQLRAALDRQRAMPVVRLGEALVEAKLISAGQLEQALARQQQNRKRPLGQILVELGHLSQRDLYRALSQKLGIPAVDLKKFRIDPAVRKTLPAAEVQQLRIVPLCRDGETLIVAMENALDPAPLERVRFLTQGAVVPVMASAEDIADAIREHYSGAAAEKQIKELASELSAELAETATEEEQVKDTDSTLVRLVNKIILDAYSAGASDIHIETNPGRKNVVVRMRRDGVLSEYLQVASNFASAIVSRLKIMASLDIAERRRAQDGRINFRQFGPANVELRMAVVPTSDGREDVVLRVLAAGEPLPLARLGLSDAVQEPVEKLLMRSFGLILVVGPTGSGKTTTLHSLLGALNSPERKIWTAEDPVEITQVGLRQVQVNARIGWTFAAALRSFLRSDPDVIMVGEMRDAETAGIAVEAALTGHLVLSTLHTNSAPDTIVRLLDMGMDPFSFADSLAGVLAQRLARRLCETCRARRVIDAAEAEALAVEYCADTELVPAEVLAGWRSRFAGELVLHSAAGCERCRGTGYRGRVGLHELLTATPALRQLVQRRAPGAELREAAMAVGMRTLKQDGIDKCLLGITDLPEVRAVAS